ncbi:MAG: glycosyltransferase family 39 protein [Candidatus Falkowbacteria bacterium]
MEYRIFFKRFWRTLIIALLAVCFFIGTSSFIFFTQKNDFVKWSSPDETANYVFSKLYAQEGKIAISEKYNLYVDEIIHPRSFRSDAGVIKPVSFLGIILIYGKIASWASYKILPFLTPFFGSIGIIFFYLLIKKIFGRRNAFISSFLLASFPPYIYYTARSMFHNVLFISLLIIGLYFSVLIIKNKKKFFNEDNENDLMEGKWNALKYAWFSKKSEIDWMKFVYSCLAGFFIGLAIITRASELIWLIPALIILWLFNIKKIGITKFVLFLSFLFLAILPILRWNTILYDSPVYGGYAEMNESISSITSSSSDLLKSTFTGQINQARDLFFQIKDNFFYFGFHAKKSAKMFYYYFVDMFPWLFWASISGFILFFQRIKKWKRKHWAYFLSYVFISIILVLYYGSWEFYDNPDKTQTTIGNSYTRYWLPVYLGAMPFASMFIIRLTRVIARKKFYINSARIAIMIFIFFISIQFILIGSDEGLIFLNQKQKIAKTEYEKVLSLTESNSVIITRYHDKLFFPERKVIVGLFDNKEMVAKYAILANHLPLYYYNFTLPQKDIDYLNEKRLGEVGLGIEEVQKINSDFTLYKISLTKK